MLAQLNQGEGIKGSIFPIIHFSVLKKVEKT